MARTDPFILVKCEYYNRFNELCQLRRQRELPRQLLVACKAGRWSSEFVRKTTSCQSIDGLRCTIGELASYMCGLQASMQDHGRHSCRPWQHSTPLHTPKRCPGRSERSAVIFILLKKHAAWEVEATEDINYESTHWRRRLAHGARRLWSKPCILCSAIGSMGHHRRVRD